MTKHIAQEYRSKEKFFAIRFMPDNTEEVKEFLKEYGNYTDDQITEEGYNELQKIIFTNGFQTDSIKHGEYLIQDENYDGSKAVSVWSFKDFRKDYEPVEKIINVADIKDKSNEIEFKDELGD
jgi:hypothetical protein